MANQEANQEANPKLCWECKHWYYSPDGPPGLRPKQTSVSWCSKRKIVRAENAPACEELEPRWASQVLK